MDKPYITSAELSYDIITNSFLEKMWDQYIEAILNNKGKEFLYNNPDFLQVIINYVDKIEKENEY